MALSLCQLGTLIVRQDSYASLNRDTHLVQSQMEPQQMRILEDLERRVFEPSELSINLNVVRLRHEVLSL